MQPDICCLFYKGGEILNEDFASITTGNSTSTSGSSTAWTGNSNFTVSGSVYQAGGAIRLGASSAIGSVTTKEINLSNGGVLTFDVKGWSTIEGDIVVTVDGGNSQTITYTSLITGSFESKIVTLGAATSTSKVTIATSAKRAFIDNIIIVSKEYVLNDYPVGNLYTHNVTGLTPATTYKYSIKAKNASTTAAASNEISVTTLIPTFSGTGDWSETARWNTALVPVTTDNVIVDGTATISSNVEVAGLTINASKSLTVNAGKQLTVSGALANNGTLNLNSSASGTATLTAGSVSGSGTANASQYLADARNWYVSSPVVGATIPASGYTFYERDEVNVGWPTPTGTFTQGRGYIALPTLAGSTLTFSGQLNLSNLDVNLTWSGASSKGFNLIGNPYPSHLTWTAAFVDANTALIEPSIYYRTNSGTANNNHQWSNPTFNAHSGASIGGATGVIPPMQAVWIRAVAGGNLTLDNTKLERSHQVSNPLKARAENVSSQNLRLVVSDGQSSDEILVYFNANASNSFDAFDSPKMMNGSSSTVPDMYTMVGSEQLVINGMSSIPSEIPLYFKANASTAGQFSLSATEMSNFETGTLVYIKNNKNGEQQLISDGSVYSFDKASDPTFSIIIKAPGAVTGLGSNNSATLNVYTNAKGQITVAMPSVKASDVVSVYNSVGQQLMSQSFTSTRMMLNKTFTAGVYVVKVNDVIRKVVVE